MSVHLFCSLIAVAVTYITYGKLSVWKGEFAVAFLIILEGLISLGKRLRYPPGPPTTPLIGNLLHLMGGELWLKSMKWSEHYGASFSCSSSHEVSLFSTGDVIHLENFGQHFVILNSEEAAVDLLEKRSAIYSDRQSTMMLNEL